MRNFTTLCVDEKTGYEMMLSDASYNVAMEWLQREVDKYGKEIFRTENNGTDDMWIYVGTPKEGLDFNGRPDVWYTNQVIYHYDESRGYLMKE